LNGWQKQADHEQRVFISILAMQASQKLRFSLSFLILATRLSISRESPAKRTDFNGSAV
jgi:hypothetical protein